MKLIISLATHRDRVKHIQPVLQSLIEQSIKPYKVVVNMRKEDADNMEESLRNYILNNKDFELNIVKEDLGPHNKYYDVMQKYRDYNIVTVDDDFIYHKHMVKSLVEYSEKYPNCICSRNVSFITYYHGNKEQRPFDQWAHNCNCIFKPSFQLAQIGAWGVLYPANCLNITENDLDNIKKCFYADDIYLKYKADQNNIKVVYVCDKYKDKSLWKLEDFDKTALWKENIIGKRNDKYLECFPIGSVDNEEENKESINQTNFINNLRLINNGTYNKK